MSKERRLALHTPSIRPWVHTSKSLHLYISLHISHKRTHKIINTMMAGVICGAQFIKDEKSWYVNELARVKAPHNMGIREMNYSGQFGAWPEPQG